MSEPEELTEEATRRSLTKVTVNLIPTAVEHMERLSVTFNCSKTDVINRALAVYGLVAELMQATGSLVVVRTDGTKERIYIL